MIPGQAAGKQPFVPRPFSDAQRIDAQMQSEVAGGTTAYSRGSSGRAATGPAGPGPMQIQFASVKIYSDPVVSLWVVPRMNAIAGAHISFGVRS